MIDNDNHYQLLVQKMLLKKADGKQYHFIPY